MAIQRYAGDRLVCLSTDVKPLNVLDGAFLVEQDTGKLYQKVSGAWVQIQGYSGYSGESGYSGYSGYSGVSGYSGYSGYSGESGYSGYSGYSGESGYSGYSGYSGVSGYSGYSGYSGESGYSGYSGYSGESGYSGYSGYSGTSGYSGYSGYSGESGYSGYSGISGYSGYSGYSGISGFSGWSGSPGTLVGITYYTDDNASDLIGYRNLPRSPDADPEVTYSAVGSASPSGSIIKEFVSPSGDPGVALITNGTWQSNLWAYIDSAGGTNTITISVFKIDQSLVETELFTVDTSDITDVGAYPTNPHVNMISMTDIPLAVTDRIGVRYYANSSAGKTISLAVGGQTHYTHIHTPLIAQGYSGISGFSGYSGVGTSGYSGYSGYSGESGYSGYSGYSGESGYSGYSGYSGESGYSGYSGYSGVSGYSGYSGESGYSGYSGYSGESGYSGYSGESGYSGYSGYSGISGYSGAGIQYWDRYDTAITPSNAGDTVNLSQSVMMQQASATPAATPSGDYMVMYVVASGVSPNREVKWCMKDELGNEIILTSILT